MKESLSENLEKRKVAQLAKKYSAKGYEVFVNLPNYKSPQRILGFMPDLIAKKGAETIIIEVKTSNSIRGNEDIIEQLSRYAKEIPGTNFDLVITNPRPSTSTHLKIEALEAELNILQEGLLTDIKKAVEQNRSDLAVLLAVRLLESLLARLAVRKSIYVPLEKWNLIGLSNRLAAEHVISQAVTKLAKQLYKKRNAIVHKLDKKAVLSPENPSSHWM